MFYAKIIMMTYDNLPNRDMNIKNSKNYTENDCPFDSQSRSGVCLSDVAGGHQEGWRSGAQSVNVLRKIAIDS
jgi:hypothetical protein